MNVPLILTSAHWQATLAYLETKLPNEACGLLGGVEGVVQQVYPVENELHSPWEFRMNPREQVRAMLEIEKNSWELSGIFHSHPNGPSVPSASDVA